MPTLEEAITSYGKSAERYHKAFLHCKAHDGEFYQEEAESNKICYEYDRQLAEWLRELQERRKEQYLTIEQIADVVGPQTIYSARLWFEFARTLENLGYAVVKRRTEDDSITSIRTP